MRFADWTTSWRNGASILNIRCSSPKHKQVPSALTRAIRKEGVKCGDVEPDFVFFAFEQAQHSAQWHPEPSLQWSVDQVDDSPRDGARCRESQLGSGVEVLVMDTGCKPSLGGFCGNYIGSNIGRALVCADGQGHGTAVASNVIDVDYGVAPRASVGCARVLDDQGRGTTASVVTGLEAVTRYARKMKASGKKLVINMSLGGPRSPVMDRAVMRLSEHALVVVAAGNFNADAKLVSSCWCGGQPADFCRGRARYQRQTRIVHQLR